MYRVHSVIVETTIAHETTAIWRYGDPVPGFVAHETRVKPNVTVACPLTWSDAIMRQVSYIMAH